MKESGRIVALDVGEVRTGVAACDPMRILASPLCTVEEKTVPETLAAVARIIREQEAVQVVAGLPLNQHGERGPQAEKILRFLEQLAPLIDAEIVTQDERFTTAQAERMLIGANVRRKKRKQVIDKIAATHILQSYMDRLASQERMG